MQPYVKTFMREPRERRRRVIILLAALVVLAYLPLDAYVRPGALLDMAAVRVGWAALLAAIGLLQPRLGSRRWGQAITLGAVASNACYLWLVALAGGLAAPHAMWLPVMPLATVLLAWERVPAVALGGLVTLAGTVGLAVAEQASLPVWVGLVAGAVCLSVSTSLAFLVLLGDEAKAVAARDEAQARLDESEHRRLAAERLAIAGRLAAGVAHAVNSPLAAVKSNLHQLAELPVAGAEPGERAEVVADTAAAVEQIARIVGALRVFAQDEWTAAPPACAPGPVVTEALAAAREQVSPDLLLEAEVGPDLPLVGVGRPLLLQVLLGLLLSAADPGRPVPPRRVTARVAAHGGGVRLDVLDDGGPLPADALARRFDVLAAAWAPGHGLAVAMSRELLGLEGGRLEVQNREGGGVRHRLWLPSAPGGAPAERAPAGRARAVALP